MDLEKFNAYMDAYLTRLSETTSDGRSDAAKLMAEREGLLVRDEHGNLTYKRYLTREEFARLAYRTATGTKYPREL